jgi:hypothetical protein
VDRARREFFVRFAGTGGRSTRPEAAKPERRCWKPATAMATVAAGLVGLMVVPSLFYKPAEPGASALLAAARRSEGALRLAPEILHQVIEVEVVQSKPAATRRRSELAVWAAGERYASRWQDAAGTLRYAAWQPESSRGFVFDPAATPGVAPHAPRAVSAVTLAELADAGLGAEAIEAAFLRWLRGHQWRAVSFATDFAEFASRDGVVLRVERIQPVSANAVIRLVAERRVAGAAVRFVLETDAGSHRPRLLSVIFENQAGKAELRLIIRRMERLPEIHKAIFEPDVPLPGTHSPAPAPLSLEALETRSTEAELDAADVEVHFALHRLRACLGEPVKVERSASSIRVQGIAETAERKRQLLAVLAGVESRRHIVFEIETVEEALRSRPATPAVPRRTDKGESVRISPAEFSVQDRLIEYFRRSGEGTDAGSRATEFVNAALEISSAMLDEAWAFRRLAERYPPEEARKLRPHYCWLVEIMMRDHLAALRRKAEAARNLVQPVLGAMLGPGAGAAAPQPESPAAGSWIESVPELLDGVFRAHHLLYGAFGEGGSRLAELQSALPHACEQARELEAFVNEEFSAAKPARIGK